MGGTIKARAARVAVHFMIDSCHKGERRRILKLTMGPPEGQSFGAAQINSLGTDGWLSQQGVDNVGELVDISELVV